MMHNYSAIVDSASWYYQSNLTSCSALYKFLTENKHIITHDPSEADYIIINSCGVFKDTENSSINLYKKYHSLKKEDAKIIMYGCLVKINPKILESLDLITITFEENDKLDNIFYQNIKLIKFLLFVITILNKNY